MNDFASYDDALAFAEKLIAESLAASGRQVAIDEIDTLKLRASPLLQSAIGEVMARAYAGV